MSPKTTLENTPSTSSRSASTGFALPGAALFLLVVLVYLPAFRCGFIWDDDDYITENRTIQQRDGLKQIWLDPRATPQYYPLVHSTFWLEHQLWGLHPSGYHAVNVILHSALTVMVWLVLVRLEVPGAWVAAAVFGLHPVHVESVAWITERKNVLSGLCTVSAMWEILPLLGIGKIPLPRFSVGRYLAATILFLAALLSKSVSCSLPAACLLVVYWKQGRITRREWALMLPWFVLGLGAARQTAWLEQTHVGATGVIFSWTFWERCWIAGHAVWFYLLKLVWPHPLIFFYPRWTIDIHQLSSWIAPVSALLLPIGLWLARNRIGRGPVVAALFFGGTLLPALGFVNIYPMRYSFVADHFQYLASLGPIVLFVGSAASLLSRWPSGARWAPMATVFLLIPLGAMTWRQQAVYRDIETLWRDVLAKNPTTFAAHFHLGKVSTAQGRHAEATTHFRESLRLQTDDTETPITLTLLGNSLARQGKLDEAKDCLSEALRRSPNYCEALLGLGNYAAREHHDDQAIELFRRVLTLRPTDAVDRSARAQLGNSLARQGKFQEAEDCLNESLRRHLDDWETLHALATLAGRQQQHERAIGLFRRVLKLQPDEAVVRVNLGKALAAVGDLNAAVTEFEAALRSHPDLIDARFSLANALARQRRLQDAERLYLNVLESQPDHPQARANLERVRAEMSHEGTNSK